MFFFFYILTSTGTTQEVFQGILKNDQILKRKMATLTSRKTKSKVVDEWNKENKKHTACFEIVD